MKPRIIKKSTFWQLWGRWFSRSYFGRYFGCFLHAETFKNHAKNNGFEAFLTFRKSAKKYSKIDQKLAQNHLKTLKKCFSKGIVFWCWIFTDFEWLWESKIIPKSRPGHPQLSPGHSWSASWTRPEPKRLPKLNFWWFRLHFRWILEGFGHQHGPQSYSKTYNSCFWSSHTLPSSSNNSASQPQASKRPHPQTFFAWFDPSWVQSFHVNNYDAPYLAAFRSSLKPFAAE